MKHLPSFELLVLGPQGAGKTILLASLFNQTQMSNAKRGYGLRVPDPAHRSRLESAYDDAISPTEDWLAGTSALTSFVFEGFFNGQHPFKLFTLTYHDYPGGWINSPKDQFDPRARAERADAVLILIDGEHLFHELEYKVRRQGVRRPELGANLTRMCRAAQLAHSRPCHFVITKWDLLEGRYTLKQARSHLFQIPRFSEVLSQRRQLGAPTYLIPVSALGKGFAELNNEGTMVKTGKPHDEGTTTNLEASAAIAIADSVSKLLAEYRKLNPNQKRTLATAAMNALTAPLSIWFWLTGRSSADGSSDQPTGGKPANSPADPEVQEAGLFASLKEWLETFDFNLQTTVVLYNCAKALGQMWKSSRAVLSALLEKAPTVEDAINSSLAIQNAIRNEFLQKNPAADLLDRNED